MDFSRVNRKQIIIRPHRRQARFLPSPGPSPTSGPITMLPVPFPKLFGLDYLSPESRDPRPYLLIPCPSSIMPEIEQYSAICGMDG